MSGLQGSKAFGKLGRLGFGSAVGDILGESLDPTKPDEDPNFAKSVKRKEVAGGERGHTCAQQADSTDLHADADGLSLLDRPTKTTEDDALLDLLQDDDKAGRLRSLLARGVRPSSKLNPLWEALKPQSSGLPRTFACARALLEANGDPNEVAPHTLRWLDGEAERSQNVSALWLACMEGRDSAVEFLLSMGADANYVHEGIQGLDGRVTPLMIACARGSAASVRLLLSHACDAESVACVPGGSSPTQQQQVTALDVALKASCGMCPLGELTNVAGSRKCTLLLLEHDHRRHPDGFSARHFEHLCYMCCAQIETVTVAQRCKLVKCLLSAQVDPNVQPPTSTSASSLSKPTVVARVALSGLRLLELCARPGPRGPHLCACEPALPHSTSLTAVRCTLYGSCCKHGTELAIIDTLLAGGAEATPRCSTELGNGLSVGAWERAGCSTRAAQDSSYHKEVEERLTTAREVRSADGMRVSLAGLTTKAHLNGQQGTVQATYTSVGRLAVLLDGAQEPVSIPRGNVVMAFAGNEKSSNHAIHPAVSPGEGASPASPDVARSSDDVSSPETLSPPVESSAWRNRLSSVASVASSVITSVAGLIGSGADESSASEVATEVEVEGGAAEDEDGEDHTIVKLIQSLGRPKKGAHGSLTAINTDTESPFFLACRHGDTKQVMELLADGESPNQTSSEGESVLYAALECQVKEKRLASMKALLEAKADPSVGRKVGITSGLLHGRADSQVEDSPLGRAVLMAKADSVRMLLDFGASLQTSADVEQQSELVFLWKLLTMVCGSYSDEQMAQTLTTDGMVTGWLEIFELLLDKVDTLLVSRLLSNQVCSTDSAFAVHVCRMILASGVDPDHIISKESGAIQLPALMCAALHGAHGCVRELLANHANPAISVSNRTKTVSAMSIAKEQKDNACVGMLVHALQQSQALVGLTVCVRGYRAKPTFNGKVGKVSHTIQLDVHGVHDARALPWTSDFLSRHACGWYCEQVLSFDNATGQCRVGFELGDGTASYFKVHSLLPSVLVPVEADDAHGTESHGADVSLDGIVSTSSDGGADSMASVVQRAATSTCSADESGPQERYEELSSPASYDSEGADGETRLFNAVSSYESCKVADALLAGCGNSQQRVVQIVDDGREDMTLLDAICIELCQLPVGSKASVTRTRLDVLLLLLVDTPSELYGPPEKYAPFTMSRFQGRSGCTVLNVMKLMGGREAQCNVIEESKRKKEEEVHRPQLQLNYVHPHLQICLLAYFCLPTAP